MKKNQIIILTCLSVIVYFGGYYKKYIGTGKRADVFVFYDYPNGGRLVSNILNDVAQMLTVSVVLFLWWALDVRKSTRKAVLPFFIISVIDLLDYFLFYKQMSVFKLLLLIALILIINISCHKKQ